MTDQTKSPLGIAVVPVTPFQQNCSILWCARTKEAAIVDPGMFLAGKTIAGTTLDLLTEPEELAKAKAEFEERTGGGVGGSAWLAPLLPADFQPPIDLRWPEYVTTARGEEWWIPTPIPGASERIA